MTRVDTPFLVLPENELAYTAVSALVDDPWGASPPLVYIYGPSGTGKTHLAQYAVGRIRAAEDEPVVKYLSAAEFLDDFTAAARLRTVPEFQHGFEAVDFLVLEDFHTFEGRGETQQQLVAQFDRIVARGGRMLITSRKSPGELREVDERLTNRCIGGVCTAIGLPGAASRKKLLSQFSSTEMVPVAAEVLALLAQELPVSPRELRATLVQLEAAALLGHRHIDLEFVRQYLKREVKRADVSLSEITKAVAREFQLSTAQLRSRNRNQELALARQCAMYLARELTGHRLEDIGRYFGNRDHATVVYACRRIKRDLSNSPEIRRQITQIRQSLNISLESEC